MRWEHLLPFALCIAMAGARIVWVALDEDKALVEMLNRAVLKEVARLNVLLSCYM
jgi:hypothetical protein